MPASAVSHLLHGDRYVQYVYHNNLETVRVTDSLECDTLNIVHLTETYTVTTMEYLSALNIITAM